MIFFSASRLSSHSMLLTGSAIMKWIDLSGKQHPVTLSGLAFSAAGLNSSGLLTEAIGFLSLSRVGPLSVCTVP